jgi:hypothetical protein
MRVNASKYLTNNNEITDADFTDNIRSFIVWKQNEAEVTNRIAHGKTIETYTYIIPLTSIVKVHLTNCILNADGQVNAYKERPLFITVKNKSVNITRMTRQDGMEDKTITYQNGAEADWNSIIPVYCSLDKRNDANEILAAFSRLTDAGK